MVKLSCMIVYQTAFVALLLAGMDCECGEVCETEATVLIRMLIGRSIVLGVAFLVNLLAVLLVHNLYYCVPLGAMEDVALHGLSTGVHKTRLNGRLRLRALHGISRLKVSFYG